jgi:hypothetical protein
MTTALKTQSVMIDTMVKADAGKKALQKMAAQFLKLPPRALENGSEKKEPQRRSQGSEKSPPDDSVGS